MVGKPRRPKSEYYTTFEEVEGAFMLAIREIPGLSLDHKTICAAAASFARVTHASNGYANRMHKGVNFFRLADLITEMEAGLAEVGTSRRACFDLVKKKPNLIGARGHTIARKFLAITDVYEKYPEIVAPRDAHLIKNRRSAFEVLCRSGGTDAVAKSDAYIAKCRRYIELAARGNITHTSFVSGKNIKLTIFRMPDEVLTARLAECDARMARGEQMPPPAKEEMTVRRTKSAMPRVAPKPVVLKPVPMQPAGTDSGSQEGRQRLAAKLLAMRAPKAAP